MDNYDRDMIIGVILIALCLNIGLFGTLGIRGCIEKNLTSMVTKNPKPKKSQNSGERNEAERQSHNRHFCHPHQHRRFPKLASRQRRSAQERSSTGAQQVRNQAAPTYESCAPGSSKKMVHSQRQRARSVQRHQLQKRQE